MEIKKKIEITIDCKNETYCNENCKYLGKDGIYLGKDGIYINDFCSLFREPVKDYLRTFKCKKLFMK